MPKEIKGPFQMGKTVWQTSYSTDFNEWLRISDHESFQVYTRTPANAQVAEAYLHTNLPHGQWHYQALKPGEQNYFDHTFEKIKPGYYQFKLLYRINGEDAFCWDHHRYANLLVDPHEVTALNLYSYIPTISGTVSQWTHDLERIQSLNCNAVHLLPVTKLDFSESPYACSDLFALDPKYLEKENSDGLEEFQQYVDACKEKKIKLCLDLVFNHIGLNNAIVKKNPHWIVPDPDRSDGLKRAGCWHNNQWISWEDLVLVHFRHPVPEIRQQIWNTMTNYALHWASFAAQTDGMIRLDNLHSSHEPFIAHVLNIIREKYPRLILFAELFADKQTIKKYLTECQVNLLLATPWMAPYASDFRRQILELHKNADHIQYLFPVSSHDSGSPQEMYGHQLATIPRYMICNLCSTGASGLVQGVEYGVPKKLSFIGVQKRKEFQDQPELFKKISLINGLKLKYKCFQIAGNITFYDNNHDAYMVALREGSQINEPDFLIIANFNAHHSHFISVHIPHLQNKKATELLTNERFDTNQLPHLHLKPNEALLIQLESKP